MGRPKKDRDEFEGLDSDFKDKISGLAEAEIRNIISQVALAEMENQKTKKEDQDLENLKLQVKEANEPYSDATKTNKMKIAFCSRVLEDQGKI